MLRFQSLGYNKGNLRIFLGLVCKWHHTYYNIFESPFPLTKFVYKQICTKNYFAFGVCEWSFGWIFCFLIQINVSLKKIKSFTQKICQLFDNIVFVSEGGHGHGCHLAFLIRFQRKNNFMALTLKVLFRKIVAKIH